MDETRWICKWENQNRQCYCLLAEHFTHHHPQKGEGHTDDGKGAAGSEIFLVWYFISPEMTICGAEYFDS